MMTEPKKMLILRGNSADYPDECGNPAKPPYEKGNDPDGKQPGKHFGALHDKAALAYASAAHYQGFVLNVSGDPHAWTTKTGDPVYVTNEKGDYVLDTEGKKKQKKPGTTLRRPRRP